MWSSGDVIPVWHYTSSRSGELHPKARSPCISIFRANAAEQRCTVESSVQVASSLAPSTSPGISHRAVVERASKDPGGDGTGETRMGEAISDAAARKAVPPCHDLALMTLRAGDDQSSRLPLEADMLIRIEESTPESLASFLIGVVGVMCVACSLPGSDAVAVLRPRLSFELACMAW